MNQELQETFIVDEKKTKINNYIDSKKSVFFKEYLPQFFANFIFTIGLMASNNNDIGVMLIFSIMLFLTQNNLPNPCISMLHYMDGKISGRTLFTYLGAQYASSTVGVSLGLLAIGFDATNVPYQNSRLFHGLIGVIVLILHNHQKQMFGEILGSLLFFMSYLIFTDDDLKLGDGVQQNLAISVSFQAARYLAFTSYSVFNPFLAITFELYESIKDGSWDRMYFLYIFVFGPMVGALAAQFIVKYIYKECYNKRLFRY